MKFIGFFILVALTVACDPYGFGFRKNPAFVLDEAFKAVVNLDTESFLEVTAKELLCVYGNPEGLQYLKANLSITTADVKLNPKVLTTKSYGIPVFVGYWSYYNERYQVEILDKNTNEPIADTIVDCDYGTENEKDDRLVNRKPSKYKKKECRAIKIVPKKFKALPVTSRCEMLKVNL